MHSSAGGGKKQTENKKNVVVVPSKANRSEQLDRRDSMYDGAEEAEIAAQITVPHEGGWGWVVVFATFWSIFVMDSVAFCYGSVFADITADLGVSESLVALVNSITVALYFTGAPLASAVINRFGFRACIMAGSIICSLSMFISHFATTIYTLYIFYGLGTGIGCALINVSTSLVVGFYFERLRAVAYAIATCGSSIGVMIMFPINAYITKIAGWRVTVLLQSGLFGLVFYFGMTYRPLVSLTVVKATDDPTRTVTYLPSLATVRTTASRTQTEGMTSTAAERLFGAVSNIHFPTAAQVVKEDLTDTTQPGPSTAAAVSKLTLTAHNPKGGLSQRQINQVKSMMSKTSMQDRGRNIEVNVQSPKESHAKKKSCWGRLCHWEEHIEESRPMYRDDAFYAGRVDKLPVYQKSMMDTAPEERTGLEYQLAVSRAATTADLKDKRGVFTTAAKRIIVTMMDPKLLSRCSFQLLCLSGFLTFVGYLVPYVFIQSRNKLEGIDPFHCNLFVSVIGLANIGGKLVIGTLAFKIDPFILYWITTAVVGLSTMLSNVSFNLYFQYAYCAVFGFFIASITILRSTILVDFYGLEKLTNATGILLMFQGLGCLVSTPLASFIKNSFGYLCSFYVSGIVISISAFIIIPVPLLVRKEILKEEENIAPTSAKPVKLGKSK